MRKYIKELIQSDREDFRSNLDDYDKEQKKELIYALKEIDYDHLENNKLSEDLQDLVTYGEYLNKEEFEDFLRLLIYFVREPFSSQLKKLTHLKKDSTDSYSIEVDDYEDLESHSPHIDLGLNE